MHRAAGCQQTGFQLRSPADITSGCRAALTVRTERIIRGRRRTENPELLKGKLSTGS